METENTPIAEESVDLVAVEDYENVDVQFCDDETLHISYKDTVMIITRDVLQHILLIVEAKDEEIKIAEIERKEQEELEKMINFIETTELRTISGWYGVKNVLQMLNTWNSISPYHQLGTHKYISTLFNSALINLEDERIRNAVIKRIN